MALLAPVSIIVVSAKPLLCCWNGTVSYTHLAWRYDPVLLTKKYTIGRHIETFAQMARILAPHIDRCIFSFVEMYKKLETNMPEIIPFSDLDMDILAKELGSIAREHGMTIQTCGTNGDFTRYGIQSRCV